MRISKALSKTAFLALLAAVGSVQAQVALNLTASRTSTTMPDGNIVPMWGWSCGAITQGTGTTTCTQTNGQAQTQTAGLATNWQPPLITVPTGNTLTITLSNQLPVPTSLTIVGQLPNPSADVNGPGNPTRESAPRTHNPQSATTWTTVVPNSFTPPTQGLRAQSFVQEAAAATTSGTTTTPGSITYTFSSLRPGTYLVRERIVSIHPGADGAVRRAGGDDRADRRPARRPRGRHRVPESVWCRGHDRLPDRRRSSLRCRRRAAAVRDRRGAERGGRRRHADHRLQPDHSVEPGLLGRRQPRPGERRSCSRGSPGNQRRRSPRR